MGRARSYAFGELELLLKGVCGELSYDSKLDR